MANQLQCPHCKKSLSFDTERPRFCSNCGNSLGSTEIEDFLEATQDFRSSSARAGALGPTEVPERIGPYRIVRLLGRGGMGAVYEAEDVNSGRRVAVKMLDRHARQSSEAIERFKREGQIAASISHARSTFIYGAGQQDGMLYIVMELMPGGTIKDEVSREGPMTINRAVDCMLDVIDGAEAAHRAGIIHRDIKPSNCFVQTDGHIKLGDYGLSKSFLGDASLTRVGSFMGTPQFAATEQIKGNEADERTDIYAIGCTLFFALTGKAPFEGDIAKVIAGIASESAPNVRKLRPGVPKTLARIIAQSLEKDRSKRPQTLNELRHALLPFATQGSTFADVGRRIAAFFIDSAFATVVATLLILPLIIGIHWLLSQSAVWRQDFSLRTMILQPIIFGPPIVTIIYFAIAESTWGCGVGKLIMGLRVSNMAGERPGVPTAALRSFLFPGIMLLVVCYFPSFFGWESTLEQAALGRIRTGPASGSEALSDISLALQRLIITYATWIIGVLFLVTMRKKNGYRGVHEMATGTRVQRRLYRRILDREVIPLVAARQLDEPVQIGPYQVVGQLGESNEASVYLGWDTELDRSVWVSRTHSQAEPDDPRGRLINRPTRQRWLAQGRDEQGEWNAWEAIRGVPLAQLLANPKNDWPEICAVLVETAEELAASASDGLITKSFDVQSVWIDEHAQIKVLSPPIHLAPEFGAEAQGSPTGVLKSLLELVSRSTTVPVHFLEFVESFRQRPDRVETLRWAASRLRSMMPKATKWRWDDRLGAIAISAGLEQTIYQSMTFAFAFVLSAAGRVSLGVNFALIFVLSSVALFAIGYWFRGGLVFRLLKIQVRDAKSQSPVRPWRPALRHWIAWSPFILSYSIFTAWIAFVVSGAAANAADIRSISVVVGTVGTLPMWVFYLGGLFAICVPPRGLPDFICRTKLLRS